MDYLPIARIILRYGIGYVIGSEAGAALSLDPDVAMAVAFILGAVVEAGYAIAKKRGGAT